MAALAVGEQAGALLRRGVAIGSMLLFARAAVVAAQRRVVLAPGMAAARAAFGLGRTVVDVAAVAAGARAIIAEGAWPVGALIAPARGAGPVGAVFAAAEGASPIVAGLVVARALAARPVADVGPGTLAVIALEARRVVAGVAGGAPVVAATLAARRATIIAPRAIADRA